MTKRRRAQMMAIAKALQEAADGRGLRLSDVWSDWLFITEASLRMMPVHAQSLHDTGEIAQDPPEIAEDWQWIQGKYADDFQHLCDAYSLLLETAAPIGSEPPEIYDLLGPLYMEVGNPSISAGQFFTPWEMCVTIAKTIMADAPALVYQRMERALQHDPMHAMMMGERTGWITPEIGEYVAKHMLPKVMDHYDPVCVHDPCVGSGGMLLAAASEFPTWMVAMGLVLFYGQDISLDCTRMAQINMMLFGLNGWGLRFTTAMAHLRESPLAKRFREEVPPTAPEPMIASVSACPTDTMYPDIEIGAQGALFNLH